MYTGEVPQVLHIVGGLQHHHSATAVIHYKAGDDHLFNVR
jgi:hypothetical protein